MFAAAAATMAASQEEVEFGYGTKAERWAGTILDIEDDNAKYGGLPPGTEVMAIIVIVVVVVVMVVEKSKLHVDDVGSFFVFMHMMLWGAADLALSGERELSY